MKYDLATSTEEVDIGGLSVVKVMDSVLRRMIEQSTQRADTQKLLTKFQSSSVPGISVLDYLYRVSNYAKCSDSCFIIALVYLDRLIETRSVALTVLNVHRLIITSVLVAAKMYEDEYFNNSFYARLGGVSVAELNALELEFVKLISFCTHVDLQIFNRYFIEFWKLDGDCARLPLPTIICAGLDDGCMPPTPVSITRSFSSDNCAVLGGPCSPYARAPESSHRAPVIGGGESAVVPVAPGPTRSIQFPMPPEYFPADAAAYGHRALYTAGHAFPPHAAQSGPRVVCDVPFVKLAAVPGGHGAMNYGMGYARRNAAGFAGMPGEAYCSPHSVSSKLSPFERRAEGDT